MTGLKDQSWRLQPENYAIHHPIPTRYSDMDSYAHLNNVAIARLFEELRVRTLTDLYVRAKVSRQMAMVAHVSIDYLAEGRYPDPVEGVAAIAHLGNSSFRLALALFQGGRAFALADAVLVALNAERKPTEILPAVRAEMEKMRPAALR